MWGDTKIVEGGGHVQLAITLYSETARRARKVVHRSGARFDSIEGAKAAEDQARAALDTLGIPTRPLSEVTGG